MVRTHFLHLSNVNTCLAVPLAASQVDEVELALLERGVARVSVRVNALNGTLCILLKPLHCPMIFFEV